MSNRVVCWFSCGAASSIATKIAIEENRLNQKELVIAYCKVQEEHDDNERFLKECEAWFGQKIIVLQNDHYKGSIFQVFEKKYENTIWIPCTRALKKQVRQRFQRVDDTHIFGYTIEEENRLNNFIDTNNEIEVYSPLINNKITKENCLAMIKNGGIELPVLYKQGYPHNNCVG
ncbi:MAG: hypothetical protein COB83_10805 [Gammaproteobacteria bacterium]|nr:MAG: hypothetical protein COB83_10805 [Gammaproteobacteria bacterium]